jgi:hypothetical protein
VALSAGGTATLPAITTLAPGKHYLIASYGGVYVAGTAVYSTSQSSSAPVSITNTQTVTFTAPASPVTYGASPVTLSASASSTLAVNLTVSGPCSVSGTTLTYTGAGTCTVTAAQAGNSSFLAATPVVHTVTVNPAPLTITASSPSAMVYGTAVPTVTASYSAFVGADTKWTGLITRPTCTTAYTTTSAPGSYTTTCSGAVGANYSITYVPGSFTVSKASQTLSKLYSSSTVYGTPVTLTATATSGLPVSYALVSGPGSISGSTLTPTGVGTIVVSANQAGNANYTAATAGTKSVTVYQAPLVITASSTAVTYGAAKPTITASGVFVNGDSMSSLTTQPTCFAHTYTTTSDPGTYPTICFGAVDSNYSITYASGLITVSKAPVTVTAWPTAAAAITYGQPLSTTTLIGGSAAQAGTFTWTTPSTIAHVGGPAQSVTFTPTSSLDYTSTTGSASITVNRATPTISTPPTASGTTYNSALSTSKLSGGSTTAIGGGTFSWTNGSNVLTTIGANAGQGVTFSPTNSTDYTTATTTVSVMVSKASAPVTTWPTAPAITYGQALSSSVLSGGASSIAGTFAWANPSAVPGAGTVSESVSFAPTDTVHYSTATHTLSVTVNPVAATVSSWPTASAIVYPQTLASSTLTGGSATTTGTFAWTNSSTVPDAGTAVPESVTFTPTNTTKYGSATHNVNVAVSQATSAVSAWPTASGITSSQTLDDSTLTGGTATQSGNFAWTNGTTTPAVGTTLNEVTFAPSSGDYTTLYGWVYVTVNACGLQDSTNGAYNTSLNVYTSGTSSVSPTLDAEGANESAICAVNSGPTDTWVALISYPSITSNAASTYPADSNTNGSNAAVLAYGTVASAGTGATITISDDGSGDPSSISTANDYSNGVFASLGGTVNITDATINTYGNGSHALDATYAGTLTLTNVTATTNGNNSSVIMAGAGGANVVTSAGGTYTSNGQNSAGVFVAGTGSSVSLSGDTVTAVNWPVVVVEGGNSVTVTNGATLSGASGNNHGIFFYEGSSGDATAGTGNFTMTDGSISYSCDAFTVPACANGVLASNQNALATLFSVANTTAVITLTDVALTNATNSNGNGVLLTAAALNSGTTGSNGGNVTFNAIGETLTGDIIVDAISTANVSLAADSSSVPSTLIGAINTANSGAATVSLTLDATSTWIVGDGPSYLTSLTNAGSNNITCQNTGNCSVYVNGVQLTSVN